MMLNKTTECLPSEDGQYLTLSLTNLKEVALFEAGKMIPADDDWMVFNYNQNFGFYDYDLNHNEYSWHPQYWAELPKFDPDAMK